MKFRLIRTVLQTRWAGFAGLHRCLRTVFTWSSSRFRSTSRGLRFPTPGHIALWVYSSRAAPETFFDPALTYGEIVRFSSTLEPPPHFAIPGVADYRNFFWQQGLLHQARLKSPLQLYRSGHWEGNPVLDLIYGYADRFESFCRKNFNESHLKLILSLFLGRKKVLDPAEKDRIRELGIYHLFVISGFHVSLLLLVMHFLLRSWGLGGRLLTLIAMWSYVMLVGSSPPVLRAGLMATIFYLLTFFGLFRQFLNTLGIAAILILALSPISLHSPSFQFSFLCLLAIGIFVLPSASLTGKACRGFGDFFTGRVITGHNREDQVRRRVRFFLEEKFQFYPRRVARCGLSRSRKIIMLFLGNRFLRLVSSMVDASPNPLLFQYLGLDAMFVQPHFHSCFHDLPTSVPGTFPNLLAAPWRDFRERASPLLKLLRRYDSLTAAAGLGDLSTSAASVRTCCLFSAVSGIVLLALATSWSQHPALSLSNSYPAPYRPTTPIG